MKKIVYARRDDGDGKTPYPVKATPEVKGHHLSCYLCDCRVGFVSDHERNHPNGLEEILVEAHFAHHPDPERKVSCKWKADAELQWNEDGTKRQKREKIVPESDEHRMGKIIVKEQPDLLFVQKCIHCKEFSEISVNNNHPDAICELEYTGLKPFRFDVAYLHKDDRTVMGIVEVCHTSPNTESKNKVMREKKIPWVEVKTKELLNKGEDLRIRVINSSVMMKNDRCVACQAAYVEEQKRENNMERLKKEILSLQTLRREVNSKASAERKNLYSEKEFMEREKGKLERMRRLLHTKEYVENTIDERRLRALEIKAITNRIAVLQNASNKNILSIKSDIMRLENEDLEIQLRIDAIQLDITHIQRIKRERATLFNQTEK